MRVHFGEFVFDGEQREVLRGGTPVRLTPKAFDLLAILIEQRPRAVHKNELMDRLWPDVVVQDANVKNLVVEVRAAVGADVIRTVQRYGYSFVPAADTTAARLVSADRTYPLRPGENVIGRGEDCTIVLDFIGISRHHARIRVEHDRCVIEDLSSKNGTWRNDERVTQPAELHDGDRIRIAAMSLAFRSGTRGGSTTTLG